MRMRVIKVCMSVLISCSFFPLLLHSQDLTVMTYNIRHGSDMNEQNSLEKIGKFIEASEADIIGIVEVDSVCSRSDFQDQMKILGKISQRESVFVRHFKYDSGAYGLGLLSRFKISEIKNLRIPIFENGEKVDTRALLSAELEKSPTEKIKVLVAHLDYRNQDSRVKQTQFINELVLGDSTTPTLLLGDLNAEPRSLVLKELEKNFESTAGERSYTFPSDKPIKKIDYILIRNFDCFRTVGTKIYNSQLSDHLPLLGFYEYLKP